MHSTRFTFLFLLFVSINIPFVNSESALNGKITAKSGEPLTGAIVFFPELGPGTVSDINGLYTINKLPKQKLTHLAYR